MKGVYKQSEDYHAVLTNFSDRSFAYPIAFMERRKLLEVLYGLLTDKSKVKVNKAVSKVEKHSKIQDLVQVTTHDGEVYEGNLVVGADGVHSLIRAEMWRLDDSLQKGQITKKERRSKSFHNKVKIPSSRLIKA